MVGLLNIQKSVIIYIDNFEQTGSGLKKKYELLVTFLTVEFLFIF